MSWPQISLKVKKKRKKRKSACRGIGHGWAALWSSVLGAHRDRNMACVVGWVCKGLRQCGVQRSSPLQPPSDGGLCLYHARTGAQGCQSFDSSSQRSTFLSKVLQYLNVGNKLTQLAKWPNKMHPMWPPVQNLSWHMKIDESMYWIHVLNQIQQN